MLNKMKELSDKIRSDTVGKKTDDQYIVGLDIGTEFVKALIAKITDKGFRNCWGW